MSSSTPTPTPTPISPARRLRNLLSNSTSIIVAPGVYDGLSARIAIDVGFECLYMVVSPSPPNIHTKPLVHVL